MTKYIKFFVYMALAFAAWSVFEGKKYQNVYIALILAFLNIIIYEHRELFEKDIWFTTKKSKLAIALIVFMLYFLFYFVILFFITGSI